jgi:DNA polymerase I-like protein with 3'-5' exonuclease and polymerase domains
MKWKIIYKFEDLPKFEGLLALDTETFGLRWESTKKLLGMSVSGETKGGQIESIYIPIWVYSESWKNILTTDLRIFLRNWLSNRSFIGHNFSYDKSFIDSFFEIDSRWEADTRLMYHLQAAPEGPKPYGLKDAQKEVLGWPTTNEKELEINVKTKGGSLRKGEHYKADLEILAKYACLDAFSTYQLYVKFKPFFDKNDYWWMLKQSMDYNLLLEANTYQGVKVDRVGLEKSHEKLVKQKEKSRNRFLTLLKSEVNSLEEDWKDRRVAEYKRPYNKVHYLASPERWQRFNPNSDLHKREMFYAKLRLPVCDSTEGGKPSTSADALKASIGKIGDTRLVKAVKEYLNYEYFNTISSSFSSPYLLSSVVDSRLHPGFNVCGTVSYRLSGFKPYLLNAPFEEKEVMQHLQCNKGYTGIHADLSAIEPTITAHYSEDPSLYKVFGKQLGDIYLDLALTLFPDNKELQDGYDPSVPITKEIKERFAKERKISKVIQLAVQYTGTGVTVAKNLNKEGIPTERSEADSYVRAYWKKFRKVAEFNYRLRECYRKEGQIRNVIGRIIRVPNPDYKDLPNRFIQSSAHDVLILWVLTIYRLSKARQIDIKPALLDCHDSTSNQCPIEQKDELIKVYKDALKEVNDFLSLSVTIKAEIKTFQTLAGLKGDE